jgi:hypothetical protein
MASMSSRRLSHAATLAVAFALLLQSLAIALAFGEGASRVQLDAFGNPICSSFDHQAGGSKDGHGGATACCTFGCTLFAPSLPAPSGLALDVPGRLSAGGIAFPRLPDVALAPSGHDPGSPRAPPLLS